MGLYNKLKHRYGFEIDVESGNQVCYDNGEEWEIIDLFEVKDIR